MWYLGILIIFVLFLYLWLKNSLDKNFVKYKTDFQRLKSEYDISLSENAKLKQENSDLENNAEDTILLYDITKEICKSLEIDKVFNSFKQELQKYVSIRDCKLLKSDADLSGYADYKILPLKIDNSSIGYLALSKVKDEDQDKCHILVQQFLLGLKRAFLYQRVQELAIMDSLTGVFSRRYSIDRLHEELERSKKFKYRFSFLMIDIDHFKDYNDKFGHLVGDAVLKETAETIKENVRQIDLVGRYGGEEFLVILPETDKDQAKFAAERIRQAVQIQPIKAYDEDLKVTISIGISTFPDDSQEASALVEKADTALYQAKQTGRNKICIYGA